MDRERELKIIRRAYGKQVTAAAGVGDPQVEAAFAAVAREDFLGPGPWHIARWGGGYRATPDADPIYLYTDDVIGIRPVRRRGHRQDRAVRANRLGRGRTRPQRDGVL
jgi:protein-L-isoaspartate(D-aspartate) O-methyltransferase